MKKNNRIDFLINDLNTTYNPVPHGQQVEQTAAISAAFNRILQGKAVPMPCVIVLTRVGPGTVPPDRVDQALEFTIAQIKNLLGTHDDKQVLFLCQQIRNGEGSGVRVEIIPESIISAETARQRYTQKYRRFN